MLGLLGVIEILIGIVVLKYTRDKDAKLTPTQDFIASVLGTTMTIAGLVMLLAWWIQ